MLAPMKTLRETVNADLIKIMADNNITNAELARRMKCSPVTSLLMIQDKRNLQLDTIEKLARALGRRAQIVFTENAAKGKR
jgi:plasmid maintenance system antidote protein VapI